MADRDPSSGSVGKKGKGLNYYVLVETYTDAMAIQQVLRAEGVRSRISPTPHAIQGFVGCGVSILLLPEDLEAAKAAMASHDTPYVRIEPLECQIDPKRDRYA